MKLNIAYLLLLLVISPNLYGAASALALQDPQGESSGLPFTGQTIKGLTEVVARWSQKKIPVEYVETGKGWVDREKFVNKEIESLVILGSLHNTSKPTIANAEKNATALLTTRPLCAYHFMKSHFFSSSVNTPLTKDAEKIDPSTGKSEKIKQFKKTRTERRLGSHLTQAPEQSADDVRYGYRSQLLQGLISTQADYKESEANGALKRSLVVANALRHELQKGKKVLAIREKQIFEKKGVAESLKKEIEAFNPTISDEFAFYMSALIDVHQSEKLFEQISSSDGEAVNSIFKTADDRFILNRRELTTKAKNGTEVIFDFSTFVKKDGRLPVEECGLQARKIYKNWYSSIGEPAEATKLRASHDKLMQARKEFEATSEVDKRLFIQKQIEILQETRNDLFNSIKENVFEATKQLTSKDLAAYCNAINNRTRLAFVEDYLSDEQSAIALEKEKIKEADMMCAKQVVDDKGKEQA